MTVPLIEDESLDDLDKCLSAMVSYQDLGSFEEYDKAHLQFHMILIRDAGARHVSQSTSLNDHAERYRRLYLSQPTSWEQGSKEHREVFDACKARDGDLVARSNWPVCGAFGQHGREPERPQHQHGDLRRASTSVSGTCAASRSWM